MNLTTRERLNRLDTASDRFLSIEDAGSHRVQSHAVLSADSLAPIASDSRRNFSLQPSAGGALREWAEKGWDSKMQFFTILIMT